MSDPRQSPDSPREEDRRPPIHAHNYCVCFIDLLGQRKALQGEGLVPRFANKEDEQKFIATMKQSIGAIANLQDRAEAILEVARDVKRGEESSFREELSPDQQRDWDLMLTTKVQTQRWSDGLMLFANLGNEQVKCHMNEVFDLIGLAGALVIVGLAAGHPIRGALEIAWGVELASNELYGAAVARAYELESEVAKHPRIVVGPHAYQFIKAHSDNSDSDVFSRNDQGLAEICLGMLAWDEDGYVIVDYLGEEFQQAVSASFHSDLYPKAWTFIQKSLAKFRNEGNSTLAFRYARVARYFAMHAPATHTPPHDPG